MIMSRVLHSSCIIVELERLEELSVVVTDENVSHSDQYTTTLNFVKYLIQLQIIKARVFLNACHCVTHAIHDTNN